MTVFCLRITPIRPAKSARYPTTPNAAERQIMQTIPSFIDAHGLAQAFSVSISTIWNWNNPKSRHYRPDFPKPVKVSANATRWPAEEVAAYMAGLAAARNGEGSA